jgi:predicted DNA-binding transcriptional regulator AlpA
MEVTNNGGQTARLLNEYDVADIFRLSVATMRHWRLTGKGPKWLKLGSAVRYRPEDVQAYLEGRAA